MPGDPVPSPLEGGEAPVQGSSAGLRQPAAPVRAHPPHHVPGDRAPDAGPHRQRAPCAVPAGRRGTMYVQAPFEHVDLSRWMPRGVAPQIAQQQAGAPPVDGAVPQTDARASAPAQPPGRAGASMPDFSAVQPLTAGSMFSMDLSGASGLPPLPAPPAQESRVLTEQQEQRLTKDQKANLKPMSELMAQLAAQKKASVQAAEQAEEKKRAQAAALHAARQAQVSSGKGLTRTISVGEDPAAGTETENPVSSARPVSPMSPPPGTVTKPVPGVTPDPATGPGRKQNP